MFHLFFLPVFSCSAFSFCFVLSFLVFSFCFVFLFFCCCFSPVLFLCGCVGTGKGEGALSRAGVRAEQGLICAEQGLNTTFLHKQT